MLADSLLCASRAGCLSQPSFTSRLEKRCNACKLGASYVYIHDTPLHCAVWTKRKKLESERDLCHAFVAAQACDHLDCKITDQPGQGECGAARLDKASSADAFSLDAPIFSLICITKARVILGVFGCICCTLCGSRPLVAIWRGPRAGCSTRGVRILFQDGFQRLRCWLRTLH